ncbi:MAG: hypothetical protein K9H84_04255 [Bacteroidales bacterium]|nr:hypothetical protein [Bacteroidales bacterium]
MERKLAEGISIIFHPVLIPLYGSAIMLFQDGYLTLILPQSVRLTILGIIFVMTVLAPLGMILVMKRINVISSYRIEKRQERSLPFLGVGFAFYLTYMLIKSFSIPGYYNLFLLGAALLVVLAMIINRFWKISIHLLALGGLTGILIAVSPYPFSIDHLYTYLIILISGITGFARLCASNHTSAQVYVGYLTGLVFMFTLFELAV